MRLWTRRTIEAGSCGPWLHGLAGASLPEEVLLDNDNRKVVTRYVPHGVVRILTTSSYNWSRFIIVHHSSSALL